MAYDGPAVHSISASYRSRSHHRLAVAFSLVAACFTALVPAGARPASAASAGTTAPVTVQSNSANRIIFWTGCEQLLELNNADLVRWRRDGVGGFVCNAQRIAGNGGTQQFSGDLTALRGPRFKLERQLRDTQLIDRATELGLKLYLGMYFSNMDNPSTPLVPWFDDTAWTKHLLPNVRRFAAAAKALGFAGLAVDQELYPQAGNRQTATWDWNFPGNTAREAQVRTVVTERGAQLMSSINAGFPGADLLVYGSGFPETWDELVQQEVNDEPHAFDDSVQINLWDGMTRADGYGSIRFVSAVFYKTMHVGNSWDNAYTYQFNRLFAMFSRRLRNWNAAADHIDESPFVWISAGQTSFETARSPDYVASQLAAARKWGMGGEFANYTYDTLSTFDYGPYVPALRAAAEPGVVDRDPPEVQVDRVPAVRDDTVTLTGRAIDDMAVRVVRWHTDDGRSGAAEMTWEARGDPASGWRWHMAWRGRDIPVRAGGSTITITVEDTKGLTTEATVRVAR